MPQQVSFVERLFLSQRLPYRRFRCICFLKVWCVCVRVRVCVRWEERERERRAYPASGDHFEEDAISLVEGSCLDPVLKVIASKSKVEPF